MSTTALDSIGSPYVDRACPSWGCSLHYGHGWDDHDGPGDHGRGHGRDVGENIHLYTREWAYEPDDVTLPSTFEATTISVSDELERRDMTAEQARQHAAVVRQAADDLLKAADMLDQIEASTA
jgi:hypothetical protein